MIIPAVVLAALADLTPAAAGVKAGFTERDITPDLGMEQPGGYHKSFHRTLHDPCKVRAAVSDDGSCRVAIVGVDALIVPRPLVQACRAGIQQRCGIPAAAVMIAASHSSGPVGMVQPGEFDDASPLVTKLAYEDSSAANPEYLKRVETAIVEAVCAADTGRVDAKCGFDSGVEDRVAFNRRFRTRSGRSHTHPGQGNPEIVEVAGLVDPEVGVVGAWSQDGKPLGCIVNYACHATTSPGGISANYTYGCVGYVPTEDALGPHGGGYETRLTSYRNLVPTAGRTIADACIQLTDQLTPSPLPQPAPHAPFRGTGWGYGNVPPEVD